MVHKPPIVDDFHYSQEVVELIFPKSPSSQVGITAEQLGIEIDHETPQESFERTRQNMPPAPFQQLAPGSPSVGEEEGMEALWVEELVTPSSAGAGFGEEEEEEITVDDDTKTKESSSVPRRASSFFQKRIGTASKRWKRQSQQQQRYSKTNSYNGKTHKIRPLASPAHTAH